MSVSISRRIFPIISRNNSRKLPVKTRVLKFGTSASRDSANLDTRCREKITAAFLKNFDSPFVVDYLSAPKISQDNEVVVDVHYCALNASDILLAKNLYTCKPNLPIVLGQELVGKLVEVGDQAKKLNYNVGDKVIALNKDCYGGFSEQCMAKVNDIWKIPAEVKTIDAVTLLDDYMTAWLGIQSKVVLQEDDMIIINVGMSGIGLAAVDLATNVYKAQVVGVCATEEGADIVRKKGNVLAAFKYKDKKLMKKLEELAADKDIKMIFADADGEHLKKVLDCFTSVYKNGATMTDLLRDDSFGVVVHHLSREGRVVIAGSTAVMTESDMDKFSVDGFNLNDYREKKPEDYRQAGNDILEFFEEGLLTPTCILTVGLCKINEAVDFMLETKLPGKVVIDMKNKDAEAQLIT